MVRTQATLSTPQPSNSNNLMSWATTSNRHCMHIFENINLLPHHSKSNYPPSLQASQLLFILKKKNSVASNIINLAHCAIISHNKCTIWNNCSEFFLESNPKPKLVLYGPKSTFMVRVQARGWKEENLWWLQWPLLHIEARWGPNTHLSWQVYKIFHTDSHPVNYASITQVYFPVLS